LMIFVHAIVRPYKTINGIDLILLIILCVLSSMSELGTVYLFEQVDNAEEKIRAIGIAAGFVQLLPFLILPGYALMTALRHRRAQTTDTSKPDPLGIESQTLQRTEEAQESPVVELRAYVQDTAGSNYNNGLGPATDPEPSMSFKLPLSLPTQGFSSDHSGGGAPPHPLFLSVLNTSNSAAPQPPTEVLRPQPNVLVPLRLTATAPLPAIDVPLLPATAVMSTEAAVPVNYLAGDDDDPLRHIPIHLVAPPTTVTPNTLPAAALSIPDADPLVSVRPLVS